MDNLRTITDRLSPQAMLAMAAQQLTDDDEVCLVILRKDKGPQLFTTDLTSQQLAFISGLVQHAFLNSVSIYPLDIRGKDGA